MPDLGLTDSLGQQPEAPQAPTGILDRITGVLAHPLVQGALATYLGAVSTPRYEGLGTAIGRGGLSGLEQFGQAQQLRQQLPYLQARTAGEQAGAKLAGLQSQQLESQMAPLDAGEVQKLQAMANAASDKEEKAFFTHLLSDYQHRRTTPEQLNKDIETYNQAKRQADLMNAWTKQTGMQMVGNYLQQQPSGAAGVSVSPFGSPMPGMAVSPSMMAPAGSPTAGTGASKRYAVGGREIVPNAAGTGWVYKDDGSPVS